MVLYVLDFLSVLAMLVTGVFLWHVWKRPPHDFSEAKAHKWLSIVILLLVLVLIIAFATALAMLLKDAILM